MERRICGGCGFEENDCVCDLVADLYEKESLFRKACDEMRILNERRDEIIREKVSIIDTIAKKRGYRQTINNLIG